ncbi:MAG: ADP-ribosylglycohydrolase family protein [Verrucomicrobiota bacterium]
MDKPLDLAYKGSLAADALSMPVHWYYDRAALDRDFPDFQSYEKPKAKHPDSILWRSSYNAVNDKADILKEQAIYWGKRDIHYHQFLEAGENTVNFKLARELHDFVISNSDYDVETWAERYVECMLTPGFHHDTYVEEYHRAFFTHYAQGRSLQKCGIDDEHIGGLSQVPALVASLSEIGVNDLKDLIEIARYHVLLTHQNKMVIKAAETLVMLLHAISLGTPLRNALAEVANDSFSAKQAEQWSSYPDRIVIGKKLSTACYIKDAFPASLYLCWKYHNDFDAGIINNALVGGDNCHRGSVVGSLIACSIKMINPKWLSLKQPV